MMTPLGSRGALQVSTTEVNLGTAVRFDTAPETEYVAAFSKIVLIPFCLLSSMVVTSAASVKGPVPLMLKPAVLAVETVMALVVGGALVVVATWIQEM